MALFSSTRALINHLSIRLPDPFNSPSSNNNAAKSMPEARAGYQEKCPTSTRTPPVLKCLQHDHEGEDGAGNGTERAQANPRVDEARRRRTLGVGTSCRASGLFHSLNAKRRARQHLRAVTIDHSRGDRCWRGSRSSRAAARPDTGPRAERSPAASPGGPGVVAVASDAGSLGAPWAAPAAL